MDSFKLSIVNYQRIRQAKMEFVPGLNIIAGRTNSGKSAILRAIETAIYNIPRESHITFGETKSAVGIQYKDHEVVWRRDKTAASQVSYRIDGKIYNKMGRGQSDIVSDALGISEIELNGKKIRINFGKQMSYPFLLDATPSEMFKFIVQSGEEDNVTEVLESMKKDFSDMKVNIKTYEKTRDSLGQAYQKEAEEYNALKPKLEYAKKILNLDGKVNEYRQLLQEIQTMKQSLEVVNNCGADLETQRAIYCALSDNLNVIRKSKENYDKISSMVEQYSTMTETMNSCQEEVKKVIAVRDALTDLPRWRNKLNNVQILESRVQTIKQAMATADKYRKDVSEGTAKLQSMKDKLIDMDDIVEKVYTRIERINEYEIKINDIRPKALEVLRLTNTISEYNSRIDATQRIIEEVNKDLSEFGVCPHCGAKLEAGKAHIEEV